MKWVNEYLTDLVKELERLDYPQVLLDMIGDKKSKFSSMYELPSIEAYDWDGDWEEVYPNAVIDAFMDQSPEENLLALIKKAPDVFLDSMTGNTIVCGKPSFGKTAFLKFMVLRDAYKILNGGNSGEGPVTIPVFIDDSRRDLDEEPKLEEVLVRNIDKRLSKETVSLDDGKKLLKNGMIRVYADDIDYWNPEMIGSYYSYHDQNPGLSLIGTVTILETEEDRIIDFSDDLLRFRPLAGNVGQYLTEELGFEPGSTGIYQIKGFGEKPVYLLTGDTHETRSYVKTKKDDDPVSVLLREDMITAIRECENKIGAPYYADAFSERPIDHICASVCLGALERSTVGCNIFDFYKGMIEVAKASSPIVKGSGFDAKSELDLIYRVAYASYYDEDIRFSEDSYRSFVEKRSLQSTGVIDRNDLIKEYRKSLLNGSINRIDASRGIVSSLGSDYGQFIKEYYDHDMHPAEWMKDYYSALYFSMAMPEYDIRSLNLDMLPFLYSRATNFCEEIMEEIIECDVIPTEAAFEALFKVFEFSDVPLSSRNRENFIAVSSFLVDYFVENGLLYKGLANDKYDKHQGLRLKTVIDLVEANIVLGNAREDWVNYLIAVAGSNILNTRTAVRPIGILIEDHIRDNYPSEWEKRHFELIQGAHTVKMESLPYRFLLTQTEYGRLSYEEHRYDFLKLALFCSKYLQDHIYRGVPVTRNRIYKELLDCIRHESYDAYIPHAAFFGKEEEAHDAYIRAAALIKNFDLIESDDDIGDAIVDLLESGDPAVINVASELLFVQIVGTRSLGNRNDYLDLSSLEKTISHKMNTSDDAEEKQALKEIKKTLDKLEIR